LQIDNRKQLIFDLKERAGRGCAQRLLDAFIVILR